MITEGLHAIIRHADHTVIFKENNGYERGERKANRVDGEVQVIE